MNEQTENAEKLPPLVREADLTTDDADAAIRSAIVGAERFYIDARHGQGDLIVTLNAAKDCPIDALSYAKMITNTVKLLDSVNKEKGGPKTFWSLIEAAVIAEKAQFTLRPYPKKAVDMLRKAAKKAGTPNA